MLFILKRCYSDALVTGFRLVGRRLLCQMQVLHHQETIHYSQVTKLRKQVTALTLYQLMKDAFEQSKKEDCTLNFAEWRAFKELESPQQLTSSGQLL